MPLPHWRLYSSSIFHGLIGYSATFDLSVFNPMVVLVKNFTNQSVYNHYGVILNDSQMQWLWAIISSSYLIGAIIGSLTIKLPAEKLGRKNTVLILKNLLLIPALIMHFLANTINSIELLIVGRFVAGLAMAYTNLIPVYLAECSPTEFRGLVCCTTIGIGARFWSLLGIISGLFATETTWQYVFLCPFVAAIIHLLSSPLFHESVKYSIITMDQHEVYRKSSMFYHGSGVDLELLTKEMEEEADVCPTVKHANLHLILAAGQFRWPLFLCVIAGAAVPLTGAYISTSYSSGILLSLGILREDRIPISIIVPSVTLVISIASLYLVYHIGHRTLLLSGLCFALVGTLCMALATPLANNQSAVTVFSAFGLVLVNLGFAIGPGLIVYMLPGELAPQASRSMTTGLANSVSFLILLILVILFPTLNDLTGSYCFLPMAICTGISIFLLWKYLPETRNKPIHSIVEQWMPHRKNANTFLMPDYGSMRSLTLQE